MKRYTNRRADADGQLSVVASAERTAPVGANFAAAREATWLRRVVRQVGPSRERTRSAAEFVTRALDAIRLGGKLALVHVAKVMRRCRDLRPMIDPRHGTIARPEFEPANRWCRDNSGERVRLFASSREQRSVETTVIHAVDSRFGVRPTGKRGAKFFVSIAPSARRRLHWKACTHPERTVKDFDAHAMKAYILEASIELLEIREATRSGAVRARLSKVDDALSNALRILEKYAPRHSASRERLQQP